MSYARSMARASAEKRTKLLRNSYIYAKLRPRKLPTNVRDAIFQNCVFQLSAILEDFLLELTSGWFSSVSKKSGKNSLIPEKTRILILAKTQEEHYKRYSALGDEVDLTDKIHKTSHVFQVLDEQKTFINQDGSVNLIKEKKFPSPQNMESLFRRMGLPKIIKQISKRTKSDAGLALQAFMDVRNALAHENPPSVTDIDVERYFDQTLQWINALDREFYSHVVRLSGTNYWQ